jgi:hypothetical protein
MSNKPQATPSTDSISLRGENSVGTDSTVAVSEGLLNVTLGGLLAGEDLTKDLINTRKRGVYAYISGAGTTVVFPGNGHINNIKVAGGTLGNVTIYDNVAASGSTILPAVTPLQGQELVSDIDTNLGLTIVTAAATILAISYDN